MSVSENHVPDAEVRAPSEAVGADETSTITCELCGRQLLDDDHHTSQWAGAYAHDDCIAFDRSVMNGRFHLGREG